MRIAKIAVFSLLISTFAAASAFAETQNVRVSGDLAFRSISHWNYDLRDADTTVPVGSGVGSTNFYDNNHYFLMTTELQVDADLTDNVSTVVRLANETYWGEEGSSSAYDLNVLKAYVTLKEMLYSPMTLIVGRQDLFYGKGFIVGDSANYDPDSHLGAGIHSSAAKDDFSPFFTFDAIRVVLDYDPWTIDLAYAKIGEGSIDVNDDKDLYVANLGYVFDSYQGEAETYYVLKHDRSVENAMIDKTNDIHTVGVRGSFDPLETVTIAGEIAYQFGSYVADSSQTIDRDRDAWAADIGAWWRIPDMRWSPTLGIEYIFYSGNDVSNTTGDYEGWDIVYRGKWDTKIRDYVGAGNYSTAQFAPGDADASFTNQHQVLLTASVTPTDSLTIDALYGHFWLDEEISTSFTDKDIGDEIDLVATYEYTEDVSFRVIAAWFLPGDLYSAPDDKTASQLVGELTVSF